MEFNGNNAGQQEPMAPWAPKKAFPTMPRTPDGPPDGKVSERNTLTRTALEKAAEEEGGNEKRQEQGRTTM